MPIKQEKLTAALSFVLYALIFSTAYAEEIHVTTSTFNENWLNAVVSVEVITSDNNAAPIGTGFLVRTKLQHVLLITAKHVVAEQLKLKDPALAYRLNKNSGASVLVKDADLVKAGMLGWFFHDRADVAARFIGWPDNSRFMTIPQDQLMMSKEISAGTPILVLGFPMGLRSMEQPRPIVRRGIIARSDSSGLLADSFVFPGNSGGPVVYAPLFKLGEGLKSDLVQQEKLIGMVSESISYLEPAISPQTQRTRIVFEENTGLANVVNSDTILELITREDVLKSESNLLDSAQPEPKTQQQSVAAP